MDYTTLPCSDDQLQNLLHGDERDEEFQVAVEHVQWCSHCQSRLAELAADRAEWCEAQRSLSIAEDERQIEDEQAERSWSATGQRRAPKQWTDSMAGQLLAPPSHPEMLGRLGRYEIERLIGVGGMGVVFKGFDSELNRPVAAKVLAPHLASSGAARKRFFRESRAAAAVVDEHVVAIHNVETDGDAPFLVMQYVAGESLQARLDRCGPLGVCEILRIGMQTAKGLAAAHAQGLIHRDVKPSNILLEEGVDRALLTDFGLARAADDASLTRSGDYPGTPQFMSPEQARGDSVDQRSDLFSLGSVLYAMCSGRPPFRAETSYGILRRLTDTEPRSIPEVNPDIPDWLCTIVGKLMAKRPEDRFASAEEVAELLEDCLAHVQQPSAVPLPESCLSLRECNEPKQPNRVSGRVAPKPWTDVQRLIRTPSFKLTAAASLASALVFAGILIVLEVNKGTLTIESEADDVRIRIKQGERLVEKLTVSKSGASVRIAAGEYVVEIEGETDRIAIDDGTVQLSRGGQEIVRIVKRNAEATADPHNSGHDALTDPRSIYDAYLAEVAARRGQRYPEAALRAWRRDWLTRLIQASDETVEPELRYSIAISALGLSNAVLEFDTSERLLRELLRLARTPKEAAGWKEELDGIPERRRTRGVTEVEDQDKVSGSDDRVDGTRDSLALVLLLDPSTARDSNNAQLAAASTALGTLRPSDYCGVLRYLDGKPSWLWDSDDGLVQMADRRAELLEAVADCRTGDLPSFDPALRMAIDALKQCQAASRLHFVVLTDGDPVLQNEAILAEFREADIHVSVVHIDVDRRNQQASFRLGMHTGAMYHYIRSAEPAEIKRVLQREVQRIITRDKMDKDVKSTRSEDVPRTLDLTDIDDPLDR